MKYLITLIIILSTVYAPTELTRVLISNHDLIASRPAGYIFELCFMWILWSIAMIIAYKWVEYGLRRVKWN